MQDTASVIGILVADHQHVQFAHARGAQERRDNLSACAAARDMGRAGIVEQRMALRFHEHGRALPYVKRGDAHFAFPQ